MKASVLVRIGRVGLGLLLLVLSLGTFAMAGSCWSAVLFTDSHGKSDLALCGLALMSFTGLLWHIARELLADITSNMIARVLGVAKRLNR